MYYVIGDVHGRYDLLQKLITKLPKDVKLIFVGDLIDRGTQSKEVVKFVRENNYPCVRGNHEQFMIEQGLLDGQPPRYFGGDKYELWMSSNGGGKKTLQSYGIGENRYEYEDIATQQQSENLNQFYADIDWMKTLPHYIELDDCIVNDRKVVISHSCISKLWNDKNTDTFNEYVRENRDDPKDIKGIFNVYGHQYKEVVEMTNFSACIDTSGAQTLTAIEIPSLKYFH